MKCFRQSVWRSRCFLFLFFVLLFQTVYAQVWVRSQKLLPSGDFFHYDDGGFGASLDIDGEYAVVGAPYSNDRGAAFVYRYQFGDWHLVATLTPNDSEYYSNFGSGVSISGNTIVITPSSFGQKIYIYQRGESGWSDMSSQSAVLQTNVNSTAIVSGSTIVVNSASNGMKIFEQPANGWVDSVEPKASITWSNIQGFARVLDVSGNTIVVGHNADRLGVFVYVRPEGGWTTNMPPTAELRSSDLFFDDSFGYAVSIQDSMVVVGASSHTSNGLKTGAAYVFQRPAGGWVNMKETAKLMPSDPTANLMFGCGVHIDRNTIAVATQGTSAYVFELPTTGWANMTQSAKVVSTEPMIPPGTYHLAVSGDHMMIGAPESRGGVGFVAEYTRNGEHWTDGSESGLISSPLLLQNDNLLFGHSVNIDGNYAIIGSSSNCIAHLFEKTSTGWELRAKFNQGGPAAISGEVVVIGDPTTNKAYVYEKPFGGWNGEISETAVLTTDLPDVVNFGLKIDIDGDNIGVVHSKGASVFSKPANGWRNATEDAYLQCRVQPITAIKISGDNLILSVRDVYSYGPEGNHNTGFVYLFTKPETGWVTAGPTAQFRHSNPYVIYGTGADMVGDLVAITGVLSNNAYTFLYSKPAGGWPVNINVPTATLSVEQNSGSIGYPVSISSDGNRVAFFPVNKSLYLFRKPDNGWRDLNQSNAEIVPGFSFGGFQPMIALPHSGDDYMLIGAPEDGEIGKAAGAAFYLTQGPNAAPSFSPGDDQAINEDVGFQVVPWAADVSDGGDNMQTLTFHVSNNNNGLFLQQPSITRNGMLSFRTAQDSSGTAAVTVVLKDNGGTENGGVDVSQTQTFSINVSAVNDAPIIKDLPAAIEVDANNEASLDFSVIDVDHSRQHQIITASSANTAVVDESGLLIESLNDDYYRLRIQPLENASGQVALTLSATDGISSTSSVVSLTVHPPIVTSLESYVNQSHVVLYPNPVSNLLTVSFGTNTSQKSVQVHDLFGRVLHHVSGIESVLMIDVSGLQPGMYLLETNSSGIPETSKFIKR